METATKSPWTALGRLSMLEARRYEMSNELAGSSQRFATGTSQGQAAARAPDTGRQSPQASSQRRQTATATAPATTNAAGLQSRFSSPWLALSLFAESLTLPPHSDDYADYDFTFLNSFEDGDGSMLVAPGEQSLALTEDAPASHNATLRESPNATSLSADMEAATAADAPSAPVDMAPALALAPTVPDLTGLPQGDAVMLDPASTNLDGQPVMATALPSLDAPISLPTELHGMMPDYSLNGAMGLNAFNQPVEQRLSAFARLRFDDGSYYMHTYQIVLGRNVQLAHKDMRRLAKVEQLKAKGEQQRAQALLHGNRKRKRGAARSVISEAGGIVSAPIEMMPMAYQQRRQSIASQSLSTGSHPEGSQEAEHAPQEMLMQAFPEAPDHEQINSQVPEDPNDCPLVPIHPQHITDRTGLRGPKGISRQHAKIFYDFDNGHFCLAVLGSNGLYHEDTFLPRGACVELNHGDTITIGMVEMTFFLPDIALTEEQRNQQESGSQSRPMSFSFENGRGESEDMDDSASEDMSVNPRHVYHYPVGSDLESEDELIEDDDLEDDDEDEEQYSPVPRPKQSIKLKLKNKHPKTLKHGHKRKARDPSPEEPPTKKAKQKSQKDLPKEKGKAAKIPAKIPTKAPTKAPKDQTPRAFSPPKEKAESAAAIKADSQSPVAIRKPEARGDMDDVEIDGIITAEVAKQYNLPESLIGTPLQKRKGPGRPPKDGVMSKRQRSQLIKQGKEIEKARAAGIDLADLPQPTVKPKIARRKESNAGEDDDIRETTEKGDGTVAGDKKQTKPAKPARTPSPEMRIEDYSEEQLQRPTSNYVVLIHEAISSAPTGQMNLQQIYNYIERNYPWYKFKTTTSGWQSSVRHNLGQHDAFVKGDKEGKGYMWRINPSVSIEKERRKRQVSPPQVNHAQRQGFYPPPNTYPPYGQPGYYPGMPPQGGPPNGLPRPPPSVEPVQPRLPPSMARNAGSTATAAPTTAPVPSPYASPWAGGNAAGSPPAQNPPRPYPPSSQTPPVLSGAPPSGQYGVLYPTSAPPASSTPYTSAGSYTGPYATAGQSPYSTPSRPYTPYPPAASAGATSGTNPQQPPGDTSGIPHPSGRYPLSTNPNLIRQLEAFRTVYLQTRIEPGEDLKVDNAIKAYVTPDLTATLTPQEQNLLKSIKSIPMLEQLRGGPQPIKQEEGVQDISTAAHATGDNTEAAPTATAAAIAADAAANTIPNQLGPAPIAPASEPQKFTPNMTGSTSTPGPPVPIVAPAGVQTQRPSVEPLTPVPGSPAVQNGTPGKRSVPDTGASAPGDTAGGAQEPAKVDTKQGSTIESHAAKAGREPEPEPKDDSI